MDVLCKRWEFKGCKQIFTRDKNLIRYLKEDTKYNIVSTWECEKPILKKVWFEKEFRPHPHFIVYNFEAISAPLNEYPTDDLTY